MYSFGSVSLQCVFCLLDLIFETCKVIFRVTEFTYTMVEQGETWFLSDFHKGSRVQRETKNGKPFPRDGKIPRIGLKVQIQINQTFYVKKRSTGENLKMENRFPQETSFSPVDVGSVGRFLPIKGMKGVWMWWNRTSDLMGENGSVETRVVRNVNKWGLEICD